MSLGRIREKEITNCLLDLLWKDVSIYVLYCGDSDKMLDEDYHMPSRRTTRVSPILHFDSKCVILQFDVARNRICGGVSAYDLYSSPSLF